MPDTAVSTPAGRSPGRPPSAPKPPTDAVRLTRKEKGWNQEQLAKELNCSLSAVRYAERHRQLFGNKALLESFKKLAAVAGVALDAVEAESESAA